MIVFGILFESLINMELGKLGKQIIHFFLCYMLYTHVFIMLLIGKNKIKYLRLKIHNKMDSEQATFSCRLNSVLRHSNCIKISNTLELQNASGTRLLQCKGNPYRTFHVHSTKLGMESEFREEGESGKNTWSNHYLNVHGR